MKVNPNKFQGIVFCPKNKRNELANFEFCLTDNVTIKPSKCVKLLGMLLDNSLNFSTHIKSLSSKCAKQTNVMARLSKYLNTESKMRIMNAFLLSNLNYCSTIYHHCGMTDSKKIEQIQKRFLRYVLNDFDSPYKVLLEKSGKILMYMHIQC